MPRFDPCTYPDRLSFEANARRIRNEEIGKAFAAMIGGMSALANDFTLRMKAFARRAPTSDWRSGRI
jgi:hypothetical protein